jgi:hypothetical protein
MVKVVPQSEGSRAAGNLASSLCSRAPGAPVQVFSSSSQSGQRDAEEASPLCSRASPSRQPSTGMEIGCSTAAHSCRELEREMGATMDLLQVRNKTMEGRVQSQKLLDSLIEYNSEGPMNPVSRLGKGNHDNAVIGELPMLKEKKKKGKVPPAPIPTGAKGKGKGKSSTVRNTGAFKVPLKEGRDDIIHKAVEEIPESQLWGSLAHWKVDDLVTRTNKVLDKDNHAKFWDKYLEAREFWKCSHCGLSELWRYERGYVECSICQMRYHTPCAGLDKLPGKEEEYTCYICEGPGTRMRLD